MYKHISQIVINLERHSLNTTLYNSKLNPTRVERQVKQNIFHTVVSLTTFSCGRLSGSISPRSLSSSDEYSGAVSKDEFESWRVRLDEPSRDTLIESSSVDRVLLLTPFLDRLASRFSILDASLACLRLCLISWSAEWILK